MADPDSSVEDVVATLRSATRLDDVLPTVAKEICRILRADRLTIYVVSGDRTNITSIVKLGLDSFKDIRLPVSVSSVAGYAAASGSTLNIADVYDAAELARHAPRLAFQKGVDQRTGYRSKQMLVSCVRHADGGLFGVMQVINNLDGKPFCAEQERLLVRIVDSIGPILAAAHAAQIQAARTKWHPLVERNIIAAEELNLATRAARRKSRSIEDILVDEFRVKLDDIGAAFATFFGVEYEPFREGRERPASLQRIRRQFAEANHWLPIHEDGAGVTVIALDPEHLRGSRSPENVYPGATIVYKVTTQPDFQRTLDQFFGVATIGSESIGDMLASLDEDEPVSTSDDVAAAADNELVKLVNRIIVDAHTQGATDIHVEPSPGKGTTHVRFRKGNSLASYLEVPASYRNPLITRLKIMGDLDVAERRRPQGGRIHFRDFGTLDIELRVTTIPTDNGTEDVIVKLPGAPKKDSCFEHAVIVPARVTSSPAPSSSSFDDDLDRTGPVKWSAAIPDDDDEPVTLAATPPRKPTASSTPRVDDDQTRRIIPLPITNDVYFTVTAPKTVVADRQFIMDVWAHLQDARDAVLKQAADEAAGQAIRSKTKGAARIERGKVLAVRVDIAAFGFSAVDSILWTGTTGNATFAVPVPKGTAAGSYIGVVAFAVDGIQISSLHFELEVGARQQAASERKVRERRPSSAFASYASEDRDRVLGRIQGMQKLLPDLSIFLDVASIRSGEDWARRLEEEIARRDTFYLFWSLAASRSQWVEKEWRAALRLKGIESIDPVPLEPPQKAPPPAELRSLHFNEWILAFQKD